MTLLALRDVRKDYRAPDGSVLPVLDIAELCLEPGEQVALSGPSGSGKTTLLHVIAGLLVPDAGEVVLSGTDLVRLSEAARDRVRATELGIVFQSFHLLPGYTVFENVLLGMAFGPGIDRARAKALLVQLGLADRLHHRPDQLSIGQQQRVALARALAHRPRLVLADEPTGSLDARSAAAALELIRGACTEQGAALLLVSHDPAVLAGFTRHIELARLNRAAVAS